MGIKETNECLVATLELAVFIVERLKDGVDFGDAVALFEKVTGDAGFRAKLAAAYTGVQHVKGEVANLDVVEAVALTKTVVDYIPRIVKAAA